jgi:hypothetical protein
MSKNDILLASLTEFFNQEANFKILEDILIHKTISLRNLEWYVTNYAKEHQVSYKSSNGKTFSVHIAYKSSLNGYSKKFFDPFCRTERVELKGITTTVAQLNFIRWCIKNDIITNLTLYQSHFQKQPSCTHNNTSTDCTPESVK